MQGRKNPLTLPEVNKVRHLLGTTALTLRQLAERFSVHMSVIAAINKQHQIRQYNGRRVYYAGRVED